MSVIRKSVVLDESRRPIAVRIDDADWLEIEQSLRWTSDEIKTMDPSRFAGVISLAEDPGAYQARARGEWL